MKFVLTPVDEKGFELKITKLQGGVEIIPNGFVELAITEEQSQFMEEFCDIICYPHNKVYVINNQRFTKKLKL